MAGFTAAGTGILVTDGVATFDADAVMKNSVSIDLACAEVSCGVPTRSAGSVSVGTGTNGAAVSTVQARDGSASGKAISAVASQVLQRGARFEHGVPDAEGEFALGGQFTDENKKETEASEWFDAGQVTMYVKDVLEYADEHAGEGFLTSDQCGDFASNLLGNSSKAVATGAIASVEVMNGRINRQLKMDFPELNGKELYDLAMIDHLNPAATVPALDDGAKHSGVHRSSPLTGGGTATEEAANFNAFSNTGGTRWTRMNMFSASEMSHTGGYAGVESIHKVSYSAPLSSLSAWGTDAQFCERSGVVDMNVDYGSANSQTGTRASRASGATVSMHSTLGSDDLYDQHTLANECFLAATGGGAETRSKCYVPQRSRPWGVGTCPYANPNACGIKYADKYKTTGEHADGYNQLPWYMLSADASRKAWFPKPAAPAAGAPPAAPTCSLTEIMQTHAHDGGAVQHMRVVRHYTPPGFLGDVSSHGYYDATAEVLAFDTGTVGVGTTIVPTDKHGVSSLASVDNVAQYNNLQAQQEDGCSLRAVADSTKVKQNGWTASSLDYAQPRPAYQSLSSAQWQLHGLSGLSGAAVIFERAYTLKAEQYDRQAVIGTAAENKGPNPMPYNAKCLVDVDVFDPADSSATGGGGGGVTVTHGGLYLVTANKPGAGADENYGGRKTDIGGDRHQQKFPLYVPRRRCSRLSARSRSGRARALLCRALAARSTRTSTCRPKPQAVTK